MALQRPCQARDQMLILQPTEGWPYLEGAWRLPAQELVAGVALWHHCAHRRKEQEKTAAHVPAVLTVSFVRKSHCQNLTWPTAIENGLAWNKLTGKLTCDHMPRQPPKE